MVRQSSNPGRRPGNPFLPVTKRQPKEMLPIIDTPVIQYVVQEAVDSGIEDILIISGKGKRAIEDHFDRNCRVGRPNYRAERTKPCTTRCAACRRWPTSTSYAKGTQRAGRRHLLRPPPYRQRAFALLLGDTILDSVIPATQQLIDIYEQFRGTVLGVETVPKEKVSRYGILGGKMISERVMEVHQFVEKPTLAEAPSNLAICGRYVLTRRSLPPSKRRPGARTTRSS